MTDGYAEFIQQHPEYFRGTDIKTPLQILTDADEIQNVENELNATVGIMYEDQYIYLFRDAVIGPDGNPGTYIRTLHKHAEHSVSVLPMVGDNIVLSSQFRHAVRQESYEIPRGMGLEELSAKQNVVKELQEEIGMTPIKITYLGQLAPDTGFQATIIPVYLAFLPTGVTPKCYDKHEAIVSSQIFSQSTVKNMIKDNIIIDGITLGVLMMALTKGYLTL